MEKIYYYVLTIVYNDGRVATYKVSDSLRFPKVSISEDRIHLRNYVSRDVFERLSLERMN